METYVMSEENKVLTEEEQIQRHQDLTKRSKALNDRFIRLQAEHEGLKRNYEREVEEAKKEFGTSDIDELREKYKKERVEGSENIILAEKELSEIESIIAAIDAKREEYSLQG